jgi:hypothetical protein
VTELERLAAAILTQWRADGGAEDGSISVGALLDRVLPYRVARRILGIDVSEDYEALVLRLLAEEEDLVRVDPVDATDMAKATVISRLPDLDALQLLRSATMRFTERTIVRLSDVLPMPSSRDESTWSAAGNTAKDQAPERTPDEHGEPPRAVAMAADVNDEVSRRVDENPPAVIDVEARHDADVIPLHPIDPPAADRAPPAPAHCWSCAEALPVARAVKFCPYCGADQRQPTCPECGTATERVWKHCPDCGTKL